MKARNWPKFALRGIAVVILTWTAILDPFQLNSRFDTASQAATDRVLAQWYDRTSARPVADALALVTIDADTIRRGHAFPVSYREFAAVVQAAADNGARAVFLDFSFHNRGLEDAETRSNLRQLIGAIKEAQKGGVDVITGPIDPDPALVDFRRAVSGEAAISWTADHPLDYPFASRDAFGVDRLTPAALLYRAYCKAEPELNRCDAKVLARLRAPAAKLKAVPPLALQFGLGPAPGQHYFTDPAKLKACAAAAEGFVSAIGRGLIQGALPSGAPPCPYHLEIPLQSLASAAELMKGRVIAVGVAPELGDAFLAPGFGKVAGAEAHLMALDNLLYYRNAYPRWPPNWFLALSWTGLFKVLAVIAIAVSLELIVKYARTIRPKRRVLVGFLLATLLTPILAALLIGWATRTPIGGVAVLAILAFGVSAAFEEEDLSDSLRLKLGPKSAAWLVLGPLSLALALAGFGSGQIAWGVASAVTTVPAILVGLWPARASKMSNRRLAALWLRRLVFRRG